jgi:acyl-CoA synthetase (AMP-forming)/AMP-acid ligase II
MDRTLIALPLLSDYVKRNASERADSKAFIVGEEVVSYKQLYERSKHLASYLLQSGVQKGDRIAYICTAQPEFFYLYTAASMIGAIIVGMGTKFTPREFEYIINNSQAEYIYCRANLGPEIDYQEKLAEVLPRTSWVKKVIIIGGTPVLDKSVSYEEIMKSDYADMQKTLEEREASINELDGLLIVYTSGTTGNPKGALMSHQNIIHVALVTADEVESHFDSIWLNHMPVNHVSGATEIGASALVSGASQVLLETFHPLVTLQCIEKYKITVLGQVPTMYAMEFSLPNLDQFDLSSLHCCIVSGSPLSEELANKIYNKMCRNISNDLGMTETSGLITYTRKGAPPNEIASSIGNVPPEFEFKIVDQERNEVIAGETGELTYRGTNVIKEYFMLPEATAKSIDSEGWFHSGDLAMMGTGGQLHMMGRSSEMFITGGDNVYPAEIEEIIGNFENVMIVACLGIPDPIWGEVGRAYIVPKPGTSIDEAKLRGYMEANLAKYKIPRELVFRDALPLTSIGKVEKKLLRQEMAQ